jgi:alkyl sulfatase BDS1-like metallo-beta-lactamase superfamily hydrolase
MRRSRTRGTASCSNEAGCRTFCASRDAHKWAAFLNETIGLHGASSESVFASHHWPMWDNARIIDYLKKQCDLYKYIHDQSVRLMNQGYTGTEIADAIELPPELDQAWYNRGYYGTVRHDSRAGHPHS